MGADAVAASPEAIKPGPRALSSPLMLRFAVVTAMLLVAATKAPAEEIFVDRAAATGLDFFHYNGATGELYYVEIMGSGAALLDYDGDGDLDVYAVQGTLLGAPGRTIEQSTFPPRHPVPLTDRLYRNDLHRGSDGSPVLQFTDVTERSGLRPHGFGMGVATGDYDNDGWIDLYVTRFQSNQLLHNNGDGTFSDATEESGTNDGRWSVPAIFFDYDEDGWLDLYVGNYVHFTFSQHRVCTGTSTRGSPSGAPDYCGPLAYEPQSDRLFHNLGEGRFENVSAIAGLQAESAATLGAISLDFNGDELPDLYVGNDAYPNNLWLNQGDGTFVDEGLLAGCSVNAEGEAEASMGIDGGDLDGDGDPDLFMAHLAGETNTLYLNDGNGIFEDSTLGSGVSMTSFPFTGFGTVFIDFDNNGWLDVLVANGAVNNIESQRLADDPFPFRQSNFLFENLGGVRFEEITTRAGSVFGLLESSRGAALGDVDNDGDHDVLIANNNGPIRLLINENQEGNHWLGLRALGTEEWPRDALGARATVSVPSGGELRRQFRTDGSYAAGRDPRVLVGLGSELGARTVEVRWPGGSLQKWRRLPGDRYHVLRQRDRPSGQ